MNHPSHHPSKGRVTQAEQALLPVASWRQFVPTAPGLCLLAEVQVHVGLASVDHLSGWDSTGHVAGTQQIFAQ